MNMIRYILAFLLLSVIHANAEPTGIIIGIRGSQERFDQQAFEDFAKKRNLTPVITSPYYMDRALTVIKHHNGYYELYGYSLGAQTVKQIVAYLHQTRGRMPDRIITVGAHRKTTVDFSGYNINFENYFDGSGKGNPAPGKHLIVTHDKIMRHVSDNF